MRLLNYLLFVLTLSFFRVEAQGIEFFHGTWEEALLKARAEDKIIFVDAYTTWCGPCKRMAANTFPDPEVGKLFNQHFISMKIDMEKEQGLEFRKKFPVSSYPTLFFIDYEQIVVQKSIGAKSPPDLIALGESIIAKYDRSTKYESAYAAGDRSYELVYNYVAALNKSGKPSVKIANDFLADQKDVTTPENLKFILEAASQVDCQCFDLFEKYKTAISKVVDATTIQEKVRRACYNTAKRAIEFESPDLIQLAAEAMKRHIPAEADFFLSESEIKYALALHDTERIPEMVRQHLKKHIKSDPVAQHQLAQDLDKYVGDHAESIDVAITLSARAAKEKNPKFVFTYAHLVYKYRGKTEALQILEEALKGYNEEAEKNNKDYNNLKGLRNKIQHS